MKRLSNIELLRIVSILLIISFHYAYKGGFQFANFTFNELVIKTFWMFGELGVNLFVLITGYFMVNSIFKGSKLVLLLAEVMFYHLSTVFIAYKIGIYYLPINIREWIMLFLPTILNNYWFITAYIIIYIISPFLNKLVLSLSKREYIKLLLVLLFLYSIIPTIVGFLFNNTETLLYYTRLLWLIIVYFIGAYIRLYGIKTLCKKRNSIIACGITFSILVLSILIIEKFEDVFSVLGTTETAYFWRPNTILLFLLSVFVFYIFLYLDLPQNRIINRISSTTLGIYILHDSILSSYLWNTVFKNVNYQDSPFLLCHIVVTTLIIFCCGVVIDLFRQWIERKTIKNLLDSKNIREFTEIIEKKVVRIIELIENA